VAAAPVAAAHMDFALVAAIPKDASRKAATSVADAPVAATHMNFATVTTIPMAASRKAATLWLLLPSRLLTWILLQCLLFPRLLLSWLLTWILLQWQLFPWLVLSWLLLRGCFARRRCSHGCC
jgi:hypothetical protein